MKKKVLIIENDKDIRELVDYLLQEEGYEVIAANPWPAHLLHTHQANLILLDEWVNKKEGHLLCTELKDMHETQHIPVILMSTNPNIEAIAVECKAEGYVRKPFNLDELLDEVARCLGATQEKTSVNI